MNAVVAVEPVDVAVAGMQTPPATICTVCPPIVRNVSTTPKTENDLHNLFENTVVKLVFDDQA
jgi:hypothetical protein